MLEKLLNSEMDDHLGYEKHEESDSNNSRNGYSKKNVRGLFGSTEIKTPRDRQTTFNPIIVQKNISNIQVLNKQSSWCIPKDNQQEILLNISKKFIDLI